MISPKQHFYKESHKKEIKLRSSYGWIYRLFKKHEEHREDTVLSLLPCGHRFLDIGCGSGSLIFRASHKYDELFGVDIAKVRLKSAEILLSHHPEAVRKKVRLVYGDADTRLPFPSDYFDTVTLVAVLEHLFDPVRVMKEVRRVLKVGSRVIVQVPNLGFLPRRLAIFLGNLPVTSEDETGWDGGHLHYFTVSSVYKLIEDCGFHLERLLCSGIFAPYRRWWISMFGADIIFVASKK